MNQQAHNKAMKRTSLTVNFFVLAHKGRQSPSAAYRGVMHQATFAKRPD